MRHFLLPVAAMFGICAATSNHALADVALYSSIPDLNAVSNLTTLASYGQTGKVQVYDTFKLDSPSNITQIDFAVGIYNIPANITVAIVPLLGRLPDTNLSHVLYSETSSDYTVTPSSSQLKKTDIITVSLDGFYLAAGTYDITFYGVTSNGFRLNLADYLSSPEAISLGYQAYQVPPNLGFLKDSSGRSLSLGFDLIGYSVAVPEPASAGSLCAGLVVLAATHRYRRRQSLNPPQAW